MHLPRASSANLNSRQGARNSIDQTHQHRRPSLPTNSLFFDAPFKVRIPQSLQRSSPSSSAPLPYLAFRKSAPDPILPPQAPTPQRSPVQNTTSSSSSPYVGNLPIAVLRTLVHDFLRTMINTIQYYERSNVITRADSTTLQQIVNTQWATELKEALAPHRTPPEAAETLYSIFHSGTETIRMYGNGPLIVGNMTALNQLEELQRHLKVGCSALLRGPPLSRIPVRRVTMSMSSCPNLGTQNALPRSRPQSSIKSINARDATNESTHLNTYLTSVSKALKDDNTKYERFIAEGVAAQSSGSTLILNNIPWPDGVIQLCAGGTHQLKSCVDLQLYLKTLQIRWHPDRFLQQLGHHLLQDDVLKEKIMLRVTKTAQQINDLRSRISLCN